MTDTKNDDKDKPQSEPHKLPQQPLSEKKFKRAGVEKKG